MPDSAPGRFVGVSFRTVDLCTAFSSAVLSDNENAEVQFIGTTALIHREFFDHRIEALARQIGAVNIDLNYVVKRSVNKAITSPYSYKNRREDWIKHIDNLIADF